MPESYPSADDVRRLAAAIEGLSGRMDRQATDSTALIARLDNLSKSSAGLARELAAIRAAMAPRRLSGPPGPARSAEWLEIFVRGLERLSRRT